MTIDESIGLEQRQRQQELDAEEAERVAREQDASRSEKPPADEDAMTDPEAEANTPATSNSTRGLP